MTSSWLCYHTGFNSVNFGKLYIYLENFSFSLSLSIYWHKDVQGHFDVCL